MPEKRAVTIYDIAKKLNLSASTISRGLRNHPAIKQATINRIQDAAQNMGYQQNPFASNLRKNQSNTIGMILPYWASSFYDLVLAVCIFGVGGGVAMPAIMAYAVIKGDEKKAMGSMMSIMTIAHSMGMLTGSMAAGLAMDYLSLRLSFPCGTFIMAAGTLVFWVIMYKKPDLGQGVN